eukprot:scaffold28_cov515-Prasinococcus_capsulatus_cf.AAC.26
MQPTLTVPPPLLSTTGASRHRGDAGTGGAGLGAGAAGASDGAAAGLAGAAANRATAHAGARGAAAHSTYRPRAA